MDLRAKTCCFTGHRSLSGAEKLKAAVRLRRVIEEQIKAGIVFYGAGGALGFDTLAAQTVLDMKKEYPQLRLILVLPYLNGALSADGYDETVYPPLESVPRRYAILRRNEWMIQRCDVLVAYVTHGWGGAARTLAYARKKKKTILAYGE